MENLRHSTRSFDDETESNQSKRFYPILITAIAATISFHAGAYYFLKDYPLPFLAKQQPRQKEIQIPIAETPEEKDPIVIKENLEEFTPQEINFSELEIPPVIPDKIEKIGPNIEDISPAALPTEGLVKIPSLDLPTSINIQVSDLNLPNKNPISIPVPNVPAGEPQSIAAGDPSSLDSFVGKGIKGGLGKDSGVAQMGADLLFKFNQYELRQGARLDLIKLCAIIQSSPNTRVIIEGHTDTLGSTEHNIKLSLLRAKAVRDFVQKNGIPIKNVFISGIGPNRPTLAPLETIADIEAEKKRQAPNRRVEIHFRKPGEDMPQGDLKDSTWQPDFNLSSPPPALPKPPRATMVEE